MLLSAREDKEKMKSVEIDHWEKENMKVIGGKVS